MKKMANSTFHEYIQSIQTNHQCTEIISNKQLNNTNKNNNQSYIHFTHSTIANDLNVRNDFKGSKYSRISQISQIPENLEIKMIRKKSKVFNSQKQATKNKIPKIDIDSINPFCTKTSMHTNGFKLIKNSIRENNLNSSKIQNQTSNINFNQSLNPKMHLNSQKKKIVKELLGKHSSNNENSKKLNQKGKSKNMKILEPKLSRIELNPSNKLVCSLLSQHSVNPDKELFFEEPECSQRSKNFTFIEGTNIPELNENKLIVAPLSNKKESIVCEYLNTHQSKKSKQNHINEKSKNICKDYEYFKNNSDFLKTFIKKKSHKSPLYFNINRPITSRGDKIIKNNIKVGARRNNPCSQFASRQKLLSPNNLLPKISIVEANSKKNSKSPEIKVVQTYNVLKETNSFNIKNLIINQPKSNDIPSSLSLSLACFKNKLMNLISNTKLSKMNKFKKSKNNSKYQIINKYSNENCENYFKLVSDDLKLNKGKLKTINSLPTSTPDKGENKLSGRMNTNKSFGEEILLDNPVIKILSPTQDKSLLNNFKEEIMTHTPDSNQKKIDCFNNKLSLTCKENNNDFEEVPEDESEFDELVRRTEINDNFKDIVEKNVPKSFLINSGIHSFKDKKMIPKNNIVSKNKNTEDSNFGRSKNNLQQLKKSKFYYNNLCTNINNDNENQVLDSQHNFSIQSSNSREYLTKERRLVSDFDDKNKIDDFSFFYNETDFNAYNEYINLKKEKLQYEIQICKFKIVESQSRKNKEILENRELKIILNDLIAKRSLNFNILRE